LQRVAAVALEKGCERLQWEVLDWNTPAIDFYSAMGAEFMDEWRNVRLGGEAIRRLAENAGESGRPPFRQEAGERTGQHAAQGKPAGTASGAAS